MSTSSVHVVIGVSCIARSINIRIPTYRRLPERVFGVVCDTHAEYETKSKLSEHRSIATAAAFICDCVRVRLMNKSSQCSSSGGGGGHACL